MGKKRGGVEVLEVGEKWGFIEKGKRDGAKAPGGHKGT